MKNILKQTHLKIAHNKRHNTNQCCNKTLSLFIILIISMAIATGCGTKKQYLIQSNPEGALIISHNNRGIDASSYISYHGETPDQVELTYLDDEYYFTVEKRGYSASSQPVTKDSDPNLSFHLERLEGTSKDIFSKGSLQSGIFLILPPHIEVFIHSGVGVGPLDKTEKSNEKSSSVMAAFYTELKKELDKNNYKQIDLSTESNTLIQNNLDKINSDLNLYLEKLDNKRLNYYSVPPLITANIEGFEAIIEKIQNQTDGENIYLLYVKGKCVSETTGRKVGNFIVSVLGPTNINTPDYTIMTLFVIDAKTSEVLFIKPIAATYFDITDVKDLKTAARILGNFSTIKKEDKK